jgi:hypothetical protein
MSVVGSAKTQIRPSCATQYWFSGAPEECTECLAEELPVRTA